MHYKGGAVLALDMLHWGVYMLMANGQPPDPAIVGDSWREMWDQRVAAVWPLAETWLEHQRRDEYWKHGSVCEDYGAIQCAVYAAGGWQDGYSNAIPRLGKPFDGSPSRTICAGSVGTSSWPAKSKR